jgi:outer membrane protein OmpA-like peptidoglycan-associated protein
MKKFIFLIFLILSFGCYELKNSKDNTRSKIEKAKIPEDKINTISETVDDIPSKKEKKDEYKPDWSKPFMSPYGKPIINIIRAYFMVGEFQLVKKFIVNSECFDDYEFEYLLRNCSWGYEIDVNNMKWQKDSTFLMTAKSIKNQTFGMEQYLGKIVNDTAKIFLFGQNKENPFIFDKKYPSAEIQCQIESLAKTIEFEYDSSKLTSESRVNLKNLYRLVSSYTNLNFIVSGHTSSEGTYDYNMRLSTERAKAVRSHLIYLGIKSSKINFNGFGSSSPIYSDSNPKLRAKNRRVEISILN